MTDSTVLHRNLETHGQEPAPASQSRLSGSAYTREDTPKCDQRLELMRRLISAGEEERKRIARVLENDISPMLVRILDTLNTSRPSPAVSDAALLEIQKLAIQALSGINHINSELYPSHLDSQGLPVAISAHAAKQLQGTGIEFRLRQFGDPSHVPASVEIALFRVVQAALNNICMHSAARNALCVLEFADDCVKMRIADDGRGFDTMDAASVSNGRHSLGLVEMQERIEMVGGSFRLRSTPAEGTIIRVSVPLSARFCSR